MPKEVAIVDMEGLCIDLKNELYSLLGIDEKDYDYITTKQIAGIVKENSTGTNDQDRYLITQERLDDVKYVLEQFVAGFMLAKDAAAGGIDCYWDDEINDMMIL